MRQFNYTFNHYSAAQLVAYLAEYFDDLKLSNKYQLCWLQNVDKPVIGLLPKTSWQVYPVQPKQITSQVFDTQDSLSYQNVAMANNRDTLNSVVVSVRKRMREQPSPSTVTTTYQTWIDELIDYSKLHAAKLNVASSHTANSCTDEAREKDSTDVNTTLLQDNGGYQNGGYQNGIMGFIGYDIAAQQLSPQHHIKIASQPCAVLGHYDVTLTPIYTHHDSVNRNSEPIGWYLNTQPDTPQSTIEDIHRILTQIDLALKPTFKQSAHKLSCNPRQKQMPSNAYPLTLESMWQYSQYKTAFEQTQGYLYQGDSYQINLTQCWRGQLASDSAALLAPYLPALDVSTKAPYSGYLLLDDFELMSCSPELFISFDMSHQGEKRVRTKPIKGTSKRSLDSLEDAQLKQALQHSEKDRSENVMIVDLLRNDLGKYAKTGSVEVPKLFAIESFSNVHHMVSTVEATIKENTHPLTVLFGSLPAGSVTGTPKKRAVELISELETEARGAYCGTMGYQNFSGSGQWNVLIRSLQASTQKHKTDESENGTGTTQKEVSLWAGGAITVASECQLEYQECLDKIGNLLNILDNNEDKHER